MSSSEYYNVEEIDACPYCNSKNRLESFTNCWHCKDCGYGICEYTKEEIKQKAMFCPSCKGELKDYLHSKVCRICHKRYEKSEIK